MTEIQAAGFVLFRRERERFRYLTLKNARHGDVGVPKGKADDGEEPLATALRETEEETGIGRDALEPNAWFRRDVTYPFKKKTKRVVYFAAATTATEVDLSGEHESGAWLDLDEAVAAVQHESLRGVLRDAAIFAKDPILRRGLSPAGARAIAVERLEPGIVAHCTEVAAVARELASAWNGVDADYVEAAAWLHDIGRAVDHPRHPVEGFRLLAAEGHGGYAPPCISHYTKGRPHDACGRMADELWCACDLTTFPVEERLVALADFSVAGDRRVTLEERRDDLAVRYGASPFIDESFAISVRLREEWEKRAGRTL